MSVFQRYRWFVYAAGITVASAGVALVAPRGPGLTVFGDLFGLVLMLVAAGVMFANAMARPRVERSFWMLIAFGFALWAFNQAAWFYSEIVLHQEIPDPYFPDIILFFHLVPMIAAVAWRPDFQKKESKFHLSTLNFFLLLAWWIFLYGFVVFPYQYVVLNVPEYDRHYDTLYAVENGLLIAVLLLAAYTSLGAWRRIYLNLFAAAAVYAAGAQLLNRAVVNRTYYTGSLYDVPLIFGVVWIMATALSAREWGLKSEPPHIDKRWRMLIPVLAMLAILSLPVLGLWALRDDHAPAASRAFRLFLVLAAMLALGLFVFLRQYVQDQALIELLEKSRNSYENQQRLQSHLVQKEKLASLGQLVAGAAHEINQPLNAILNNSEQLVSKQSLTAEQDTLVRKIVTQARRTGDLVSDLLSFAQQTPGEKTSVDLGFLLQRAVHMQETQHSLTRVKVSTVIEPQLPRVYGNANQLFQTFVELIDNAVDALQETGGGALEITAQHSEGEAVLRFSDTGPGLREPQRVFDPFYTTKPIGKGTGLGLSAVYGVIQDHGGQITCQNKPEGGAVFTVRFPVLEESAVAEGASEA
jgi:signal transduction histidine kinase